MTRAALLLAGGAGTRLRPLSTEDRPKQFLRIFDGQSLIRRTFERVRDLEVFVSTIERYRALTLEEIPEMTSDRVIAEPSRPLAKMTLPSTRWISPARRWVCGCWAQAHETASVATTAVRT